MTRRIHLEGLAVDMIMQGARVNENSFTVAVVPLPSKPADTVGMSPERILLAMREQMLRNIGAPPSTPVQGANVDLVDAGGNKVGAMQMQAISARGSGKHAAVELRARFALWQGHALQIVAIGPGIEPEQASHFLDSLRPIKR